MKSAFYYGKRKTATKQHEGGRFLAILNVVANALLVFIGGVAATIYLMQLDEMRRSTNVSALATYNSCIATQISRSALIALQSSESESHAEALAAIYEASSETQSQRPY